MKLKLKTVILQEMISKAIKGNGNNKFLPITSLLEIKLEKNFLSLVTTDGVNWLQVGEDKVSGEDFKLVIEADVFAKLVGRTTTEYIELEVTENSLKVKGNGVYTIQIPLDEEGQFISIPDFKLSEEAWEMQDTKLSLLKSVVTYNVAATAETMETPCYTGVYFTNDSILSTDTLKVCKNSISIPINALLPVDAINLIGVMDEEDVSIGMSGEKLAIVSKNVEIFTTVMDSKKDFQLDAINGLVESEFASNCKISKALLLGILDRLSLFVDEYDDNALYLSFTEQGISIDSKQLTGTELIPYSGSSEYKAFGCCINIDLLKSQINVHEAETLEVHYGLENAIKIVSGNITQIIALLEDDR